MLVPYPTTGGGGLTAGPWLKLERLLSAFAPGAVVYDISSACTDQSSTRRGNRRNGDILSFEKCSRTLPYHIPFKFQTSGFTPGRARSRVCGAAVKPSQTHLFLLLTSCFSRRPGFISPPGAEFYDNIYVQYARHEVAPGGWGGRAKPGHHEQAPRVGWGYTESSHGARFARGGVSRPQRGSTT